MQTTTRLREAGDENKNNRKGGIGRGTRSNLILQNIKLQGIESTECHTQQDSQYPILAPLLMCKMQ